MRWASSALVTTLRGTAMPHPVIAA